MLYWECNRRLGDLRRFRSLVVDYFPNVEPRSWMSPGAPEENDTARKARYEMNLIMSDVIRSIDLVRMPRIVPYTPSPLIGGYTGPIDLIGSVFQFWQFHIEPQMCVDVLDRAIGVYEPLARRLFWQCFNPLFWLVWSVNKMLSIPFRILGAAGFDADKIEHSFVGKLMKAVAGLVAFFVGVLTLLEKLGYLEKFKAWLARLIG